MKIRRIIFNKLSVNVSIGILDHELLRSQDIYIDARIDVKVQKKIDDLDIKTVLDYRLIRTKIIHECNVSHTNLIETLIERIISRLTEDFPEIQAILIRINKPMAFSDCKEVAIESYWDRIEIDS